MDRPIIYDQAQGRDYDVLWGWRETLFATSNLVADILGQTSTVVTGLAATATGPTSLNISMGAGNIYMLAAVDAAAYGALLADARQVLQQGFAAAQTLLLSTSGLSSGQSRWALIQATFAQADSIPGDDPNGGLLPFLNTSNPSGPPWSGPSNSGSTLNTRRSSVCTVSVIYGTAAATGTEVPPNPSAGNVGLYLIDLAFGQTTVAQNQIIVAGPSVGTGVPSNYPVAPFLAGLLNSHHNGKAGQAPKINLPTEVQGVLPAANTPPGRLITVRVLTTSGTYTPTTGTTFIIAELIGGGGAGGGATVTGSGQASVGSGGGAGAYIKGLLNSGFSSVSYTIGAGGTPISGAGGNAGGATNFGGLLIAPGGGGGQTLAASSSPGAIISNTTSLPTGPAIISNSGPVGSVGVNLGSGIGYGGEGGQLPGGAPGNAQEATGVGQAAGGGYGGGGGGACNFASQASAQAGGQGAAGVIVVWEYA